MFDAETERAFILSLLPRLARLTDEKYAGRSLYEVAAEALDSLVRTGAVVVYVDAGSRSLEAPGAPVSLVKLAVYTIDYSASPPETNAYYPVYRWKSRAGERASNILYAMGDYRVRQALTYMVEIAALYSHMKRYVEQGRLVLGFKDGPLVQQLGQYLDRAFNLDYWLVRYALRYAGLRLEEAQEIIDAAAVKGGRWEVNAGVVMLEILERLRGLTEAGGYPAGVVEDTSRSNSLLALLLAEAILDELPHVDPRGVVEHDLSSKIVADALRWLAGMAGSLGDCLCEDLPDDTQLARRLRDVYDWLIPAIGRSIAARGDLPDPYGTLHERLSDGNARIDALLILLRGIVLGQLLQGLASRDPDIVMLAYYLGALGSTATQPAPRLGPLESVEDALRRRREGLPEGLRERAHRLSRTLRLLRMRYVATDPPPTCMQLAEELRARGLQDVISPCQAASLDTYNYAPPVRLEFIEEPGEVGLTDVLLLDSSITRYKFPQGILIADRASRITREELLTAKPLEKRLIPLRYYIRSWEKRVEETWH